MKLFLAFIATIDVAFDPAIHAIEDNDGFAFTFSHEEGQIAQVSIEREQMGWALMGPDQPRYVLVSESATDDPADAVLIARGHIDGLPGDLFGETQTIKVVCADEHVADVHITTVPGDTTVDGALMVFARAHLADGPETDLYFSDADVDKPETYLLGRAQAYHYDPVTLEVSVSDLAVGDRVVDMADNHFHDRDTRPTTEFVGDPPVGIGRVKVKMPWTQRSAGLVNIADRIIGDGYAGFPQERTVSTLSPDWLTYSTSDVPSGLGGMVNGAGWTLEQQYSRVRSSPAVPTPEFDTGRMFQVNYARTERATGTRLPDISIDHFENAAMKAWVHRFDAIWMSWNYTQEREENAYIVVTQPIQPVPFVVADLDLGELQIKDPTTDPSVPAYEPGDYLAGDKVAYGDTIYAATQDHTSFSFWQPLPNEIFWPAGQVPSDFSFHPYWVEVPTTAPLDPWSYGLVDTDAGVRFIAHAVCRVRKALIERNRALRITLEYLWQDARDVRMTDSVKISVPWFDGSAKTIIGKVVKIEKSWAGEAGSTISVTIAVSVGTGATDLTEADLTAFYTTDDDYFPDGYLAVDPDVHGVAGDTEFAIEADDVARPINVQWLGDPMYAVLQLGLENQGSEQFGKCVALSPHVNPCLTVQNNPTRWKLQMRDLTSQGLLTRNIYVGATMLSSPRGIDLVTAGDP